MKTYPVNHRCDYKALSDMTAEELDQIISMCPMTVGAATTQAHMVPWEVWDELQRRSRASDTQRQRTE